MTTTLAPPPSSAPVRPPSPTSRRAPRRAIRRWAWRLLRREWRQQVLVLSLIIVAVAATTVGLGLVVNVQSSDQALLGTANTRIDIANPGPQVSADVAAARQALGTVEAIEHESVPVPGSVTPVDLRAQDPHGRFGAAMLHLASGSYPSGADQVAVTSAVAATFNLKISDRWSVNGRTLRVVGTVENPKNLQDAFALVAPGQIRSPSGLTLLTGAAGSAVDNFRPVGASFVGTMSNGASVAQERRNQALAVLLLATIGLTFIGLLAVAGFTVMAHRRLRALGMVGAIGATDRQVRRVMLANGAAVGTVGASAGVLIGLAVWFAVRPAFEHLVGHRIDSVNIPWWAIIAGAGLAILTALAASWWPARSAARMPIVAALSGRPTPPQPAHRFALLGVALAATGFVLLVLAGERHTAVLVISGILATTAGMLLLAPLGIRALAATARRAPVAVRLALRDLARFQARSGAALAAAGLAVGIAATIAITAAAQQAADHALSGGNLPTNQLIVWMDGNPSNPGGPGGGVVAIGNGGGASSGPSPAVIANARRTAESIALTLHAKPALQLNTAVGPNTDLPAGLPPDANQVSLLHPVTEHGKRGWSLVATPFVATPAILDFYGIPSGDVRSSADILSARTDLSSTELGTGFKGELAPATVQTLKGLPNYTSAPNTLITQQAMTAHGLTQQPAGWLLQTSRPLTPAQITDARHVAAVAGITIEARTSGDHSLQRLREYATITGVLVALGVLAMTVGLIRSETANDLRMLAATGASSRTRRTLTAATAAALAALGGILGTASAYLALIAWHWHDVSYLDQPPYLELATLVLGLPIVALIGGWLVGRAPVAIARRPLD
jgi:putative ABC transport system permease protein